MIITDTLMSSVSVPYLKLAAAALTLAGAAAVGYQVGYDHSQSGVAQERAEEVAALKATIKSERATAAKRASEAAKVAMGYERSRKRVAELERTIKELTKNETAKLEYKCPIPQTGVDILRGYIDDLNRVPNDRDNNGA